MIRVEQHSGIEPVDCCHEWAPGAGSDARQPALAQSHQRHAGDVDAQDLERERRDVRCARECWRWFDALAQDQEQLSLSPDGGASKSREVNRINY